MSFLMPPGVGLGVHFDPNAAEYRCCCGSFHVKVAAAMIAVLESVILLANFIASIAVPQFGSEYGPNYQGSPYVGPVLSAVFPVVAMVLLFVGLKNESSTYLLVHLVFRLIGIIFILICVVIAIIVLAKGPEKYYDTLGLQHVASKYPATMHQSLSVAVGVTLAIFLMVFVIQTWFFVIIFRCYHFFYNYNLYGPTAYYNNQNQPTEEPYSSAKKKSSTVSLGPMGPMGPGMQYPPAYPTRMVYPAGQQPGYYGYHQSY